MICTKVRCLKKILPTRNYRASGCWRCDGRLEGHRKATGRPPEAEPRARLHVLGVGKELEEEVPPTLHQSQQSATAETVIVKDGICYGLKVRVPLSNVRVGVLTPQGGRFEKCSL